MTISFPGNQYFHPIYGWINKDRPDLARAQIPNALPVGRLTPLTQDNVKDILGNDVDLDNLVKLMLENSLERQENGISMAAMPEDFYEKNISVHAYQGVQGYQFNYSGNELTVRIEEPLHRNSLIDVFSEYERHYKNIEDLKKLGYNDEAIAMLHKELDNQLLEMQSGWLNSQLWGMGIRDSQIPGIVRQIAQEYLNLRNNGAAYEKVAEMAVNNLLKRGVLPQGIDLYKGKYGEIGRMQENIDRIAAEMEAPYKSFQQSFNEQFAHLRSQPPKMFDISQTHILSMNAYHNWNTADISDEEKEARNSSIIFRVKGTQLADYGRRYEEISTELDRRLKENEISAADYQKYVADLENAFIKTQNLNVVGQALAAGLSKEKAAALAMDFSREYINIRNQLAASEIDSEKIANMALQRIAADGWPEFSLYSNENRAAADPNDPWYAIMAENALYWQVEKPYYF